MPIFFLAQLVDEDAGGLGLGERAGELAQGLAHEAGLQADRRVADLALDLGARHERGDGVDDDHVDRAGADEHVADLERLLAGVGLGDEHLVDVDADARGVAGVERVLRVDEGDNAAHGLSLSEDLEGERGLARGLGAVDLDDAAAGHAADAERRVEREGSRGDGLDLEVNAALAVLHDGALAELLDDLGGGGVEHLLALLAEGLLVNLAGRILGLSHVFSLVVVKRDGSRTAVRCQTASRSYPRWLAAIYHGSARN